MDSFKSQVRQKKSTLSLFFCNHLNRIFLDKINPSKHLFTAILMAMLFDLQAIAQTVSADITVASDGSGNFTSIQKAIDAVPSNSDRATVILIKRGLYNTEKLLVPSDKKNVTLIGESREETIISYYIYDCTDGKCPVADAAKWTGETIRTSATLTIMGSGFRAENLTIQNSAGPVGQAQALTIRADKAVFINCDIKGYQDTIYFWNAGIRCYFSGCLITGRTDYIYGDGIAFFRQCEIRSWGGGWITAPSTPKNQPYGFVFSECSVTYASSSPRAGDDGNPFRFGRPWHEYPKVAWLYCSLSGMLNPQGWGDTWNMDYAAASADLHLYEYKNTGPGATMSGRVTWAGLRALTDSEALNYSIEKVLGGTDNWNPAATPPAVRQYTWTGKGTTNNWLTAGNWNPQGVPKNGESGSVKGDYTIKATGNFPADLNLQDSSRLEIAGTASATFISVKGARILSNGIDTLNGKISTKDSLVFQISGKLMLNAPLSGVHKMIKKGTGQLILAGDNSNFSGQIVVQEGTLEALGTSSLGKGNLEVRNLAKLVISNSSAFFAKARLTVAANSPLELRKDLTTSEFFIGTTMQSMGEYTAGTNPGLISGPGKIIVGRPSLFTFTAATSGLWDVASNYSPALMPEAGETVVCEKEMETTSIVFPAGIIFKNGGSLRLRGSHKANGTIHLESGTSFRYNTSGAGFSMEAPVAIDGTASMIMEGGATSCFLELKGNISGSSDLIVLNNGKGTVNTGVLKLSGDNSNFSGTWDLTKYSSKYPSVQGYDSQIEGLSQYAFGTGKIKAGLNSRVIFSHERAAWPKLDLELTGTARVVLNKSVIVKQYLLNGQPVSSGTYTSGSNPAVYEGIGSLTVSPETGLHQIHEKKPVNLAGNSLHIVGNESFIAVYNLLGELLFTFRNQPVVPLNFLNSGIYVIHYKVDKMTGTLKIVK